MSLPILIPADFTGPFRIADAQDDTFGSSTVESFIQKYERIYLRLIVGDERYTEIRDQVVLDPKYVDLINGNEYTDIDDDFRVNVGLKEVLKQFVYYEYVKENWNNTLSGNTRGINANSQPVTEGINKQLVYSMFNAGVLDYEQDVFRFMDNYEEIQETITGSTDNGGGGYTVFIPSTLYLVNGNTVRIDSIDYVVSSVVSNTSFDIAGAALGLDFTDEIACYKPFEDLRFKNFGQAWL